MSESSFKIISVKCPDCGASLSIEEGRSQAFCSYCGAKVIIANENEHIYRNIDETEIKKAEAEREITLKKLEIEEKENKRDAKTTFVIFGILFAIFLLSFILLIKS